MNIEPGNDRALYRRLWQMVRPYWYYITAIFFVSLLSTPLTLLTPLPLKLAIDHVIDEKPLPALLTALVPTAAIDTPLAILAFAAVLIVLIAVLNQIQTMATTLLQTFAGEKLVLDFRAQLFQHMQRLSFTYHDTRGTADSTYRIMYDATSVRYVALDGIIPFITATITLISMLYVMLRLDWQLALVALTVSPILFLVARLYRRQLRRQSRAVKQIESKSLAIIQEVLSALRIVKAFGQEAREQGRFVDRAQEGLRARLHLTLAESAVGLLLGLTTALGTAVVLYLGVRHVEAGTLTLGELLLVMGYLAQLYDPLKTISRKMTSLQSHLASAERAFAVLDEAPDVDERPDARPLDRAQGSVAFQDVAFAYQSEQPVLAKISFEIAPGMRVGIAGKTGSGKTTLMNLLTRFYDPTAGQILLDGVDLRAYKVADLRNQFSLVIQDPILFSTTMTENIAYARPDATEQQIIDAAKAANAHEFIVALPDGYETQVGERGMRLSGGERQRIALARAFLKDAPILILDEPTSAIDMKTERAIMDALERLMQGRTTFMIAHRLSTLEQCDMLLVLEDGHLSAVRADVAMTIQDAMSHGGLAPTML